MRSNNVNPEPVRDAVILMAGVGSRLGTNGQPIAKPLVSVGGRPLISWTFESLADAGVRNVYAILGATGDQLAADLTALRPTELRLETITNPDWQKQNGISVLCAEQIATGPFFLAMGDHLFDPAILRTLLVEADRSQVNLAIDRKINSIFDLADATKVATAGDYVTAIGKGLRGYDAIDTGLFLCSNDIFAYLRRAQKDGDCSLSDGIRLMAADRQVRAINIRDAWWQDVDTPEMLSRADEISARLLREDRRRLPEESIAGER